MSNEEIPVVPFDDSAVIAALQKHWQHHARAAANASIAISATAEVIHPLPQDLLPTLLTQTLIIPETEDEDAEGLLIAGISIAWLEIVKLVTQNPILMYQIDPRKWEEIIAGSYEAAGYKVKLTPRSGDFGRDVIAYREGFGALRFIESVKRYTPGHAVPADDVRALLGVLLSDQQATKGIVSTTWEFAPKIAEDPYIKPHIPYRLELVDGSQLIKRFNEWTKLK